MAALPLLRSGNKGWLCVNERLEEDPLSRPGNRGRSFVEEGVGERFGEREVDASAVVEGMGQLEAE